MTNDNAIQKCAEFSSKMEEILKPLSNIYGIDSFFYTELLPKKGKAFFVSNKFSTVHNILKIGHFSDEHNSFLIKLDHNCQKFIWPPNPSDEIGTMLKKTGIQSGISLLYRIGDSIKNIGFASTYHSDILTTMILNQEELFHHFIKYFECEAENFLRDKQKHLVDFNIKYEEEEELLSKCKMNDCIRSMEINKFFISNIDKEEPVYLTKREWECLFFLCKGKSVKQISRNLNLSTRTVESYLQNCKVKFSAYNKFDLIEKAAKNEINKLWVVDN